MRKKLLLSLGLLSLSLPLLQSCFPLVITGAAVGVMSMVDRRTLGTQTEDEAIEWKVSSRLSEKLGDRIHFNVTSYNRKVLVSGEAHTPEIKAEATRLAENVPNVKQVYNELQVGPISSFSARSNDAFITSKIKSRSLDNGKFNPIQVKVVTEAGTAFLMGILMQQEADAAIDVARTTAGVKKVVTLIEIVTPAQVKEIDLAQQHESSQKQKEN